MCLSYFFALQRAIAGIYTFPFTRASFSARLNSAVDVNCNFDKVRNSIATVNRGSSNGQGHMERLSDDS